MRGLEKAIKSSIGLVQTAFASAIVKGAYELAQMAEEADDVHHRFDVAFGGMSGTLRAWTKDFASATNQSAVDVENMASSIGMAAESMGFSEQAAAGMSQAILAVGTDMAAFLGQDPAQGIEAVERAMKGSTRGLKEYGVVIGESEITQKALALGIADTAESMTQQDKAAATLALIMEKTNKLQGEAVKQSGDLDRQMAALAADTKDVGIAIGQVLVPFIGSLVKSLRLAGEGMSKLFLMAKKESLEAEFEDATTEVENYINILKKIPSMKENAGFMSDLAAAQERQSAAADALNGNAQEFASVEDKVNQILGDNVKALEAAKTPAEALAKAFDDAAKNTGDMADNLKDSADLIKGGMTPIGYDAGPEISPELLAARQAELSDATTPEMQALWDQRGGGDADLGGAMSQEIAAGFSTTMENSNAIAEINEQLAAGNQLSEDERAALEAKLSLLQTSQEQVGVDMIAGMAGVIGGPVVGAIAGPLLDAVVNNPDQIGEYIETMMESIGDALIVLASNLDEVIGGLIESLPDIMYQMMIDLIAAVVVAIKDIFSGDGFLKDVFGDDGLLDFGIFRADGGPVSAGHGYIVGEEGPEWFQPSTSGTILPAGETAAMSAGSTITFAPVIHLSGGATNADAERVANAIKKLLRTGEFNNLVARAA